MKFKLGDKIRIKILFKDNTEKELDIEHKKLLGKTGEIVRVEKENIDRLPYECDIGRADNKRANNDNPIFFRESELELLDYRQLNKEDD